MSSKITLRGKRFRAFTLIEIMVVVAIMGIVLAMGVPSLVRASRKEGMRKAVSDIIDACSDARADAILNSKTSDMVIRPLDRTISGGKFTATFDDNISIETLGVNFQELKDAEEAKVHFYPNGTCDEFTIVMQSSDDKGRQIDLEIMTGLAEVKTLR